MTNKKVIDISQFNNVTNWEKVKAVGYPVIIRIGYRGNKTGIITYEINQNNDYVKGIIKDNPEFKKLLKLLSLTLPYESIYADKADGNEINKNLIEQNEFEQYLQCLPAELAKKLRGMYYGI